MAELIQEQWRNLVAEALPWLQLLHDLIGDGANPRSSGWTVGDEERERLADWLANVEPQIKSYADGESYTDGRVEALNALRADLGARKETTDV